MIENTVNKKEEVEIYEHLVKNQTVYDLMDALDDAGLEEFTDISVDDLVDVMVVQLCKYIAQENNK